MVGGLTVSYAMVSFLWSEQLADLIVATVIFGLGGGISMPALMAMALLKGNRANAMGSIMALMTVAHSLGMFSGALMGGVMMDFYQLRAVFPLGGMVMLACSGLFLISTNLRKN